MEYVEFHIEFFVSLFTFRNKINLSLSIHLLGTHYNFFDKLIKNIQLHTNTQR